MKQVIRYQCSFCKKLAARPSTIQKHELECVHNPDGKNCFLCKYSVQGGWEDTPFGEQHTDAAYCLLEGLPLWSMRQDGETAMTCEYFARDDKFYYERNEEDVRKQIEADFPF